MGRRDCPCRRPLGRSGSWLTGADFTYVTSRFRGTLLNWDEVPALSEDFARADERIRERVIQLVDELAPKQQR